MFQPDEPSDKPKAGAVLAGEANGCLQWSPVIVEPGQWFGAKFGPLFPTENQACEYAQRVIDNRTTKESTP